LGVNATVGERRHMWYAIPEFQSAPTLGGECYDSAADSAVLGLLNWVSMGTHPWG